MKVKEALILLGDWIRNRDEGLDKLVRDTCDENPWFIPLHVNAALEAIAAEYLNQEKISKWLNSYPVIDKGQKKVALVMAGNIPLVGFHDLLCVLISGHRASIKLSEKDKRLLPGLVQKMEQWYPEINAKVEFHERLSGFDAAIATGSNQTSVYFHKYFAQYPHIIRRNRNAVGVLSGQESEEQILRLGEDIFNHYGMGCRSVSKIYVPAEFDFARFLEILNAFRWIADHSKYKNNYDYNFAAAVLNRQQYLCNDCLIMLEEKSISSRIAVLHFEYYEDLDEVTRILESKLEQIQCIVSEIEHLKLPHVSFGKAQQPTLFDYADGIDTLRFLIDL